MWDRNSWRVRIVVAVVAAVVGGVSCGDCGDPPGPDEVGVDGGDTEDTGPVCIDEDGDGYFVGENCDKTPEDCDDNNVTIYPGANEKCDGINNDCDSTTDEGCDCQPGETRLCSSHVGNPEKVGPKTYCRPGIQRCQEGGKWSDECDGERGPRSKELCNRVDDDCDGQVDEGVRNAAGQCSSSKPEERCGTSGEGNGLDDDGDGEVDEDCSCKTPDLGKNDDPGNLPRKDQPCYSGPPDTLGVGICEGGSRDCTQSGMWTECDGEVLPQEETCGDGVDNDCDGFVDEGCECENTQEETCNGEDDDCDGKIDEGVVMTCGACEAASEETCGDGLDNDCNGSIDEGCGGCSASSLDCFPGPPDKAGEGVCEMGTMECTGETFGACKGYVLPKRELCGADGTGNGKDDDCDGKTDEGCICTPGETRKCGKSTGVCERGTQTCQEDATWGACKNQKTPPMEGEVCNGTDDDCDGLVDEDVKNACGKCSKYCYEDPANPKNEGGTDDGAKYVPPKDSPTNKGGVTLEEKETFPPYLWAANDAHDTVSKFHTLKPQKKGEVGRYWVGSNPSRTAVDLNGNMWVLTRDGGRVSKVFADKSDCIDRNGNGSIDTSTSSNIGSAGGHRGAYNDGSNPLKDECVALSKVIHPSKPNQRSNNSGNGGGVAVDSSGTVWIGYGNVTNQGGIQSVQPSATDGKCSGGTSCWSRVYVGAGTPLYRPNGNNVYQKTTNTVTPGRLYGLVGDTKGNIWAAHSWFEGGRFSKFDTKKNQWVKSFELSGHGCYPYGIGLDGKDRVFFGCYNPNGSDGGGVGMYDPSTGKLTTFQIPDNSISHQNTVNAKINCASCNNGQVTALAAEPKTGEIWAAIYQKGYIGRLKINENDFSKSTWTFIDAWPNQGGGFSTRGISFDPKGYGWHMGPSDQGVVRIDPNQNKQVGKYNVGTTTHYTYSDFTGSTALSFTAPRGNWSYCLDTKFSNAEPDFLELKAYVPQKTSLRVRMRALSSGCKNPQPASKWIPRTGGSPTWWSYPSGASNYRINVKSPPGGLISGRSFQVEVRLQTNDTNQRPILYDAKVLWQRP